MRLYPDVPSQRLDLVVRDLATLLALVLFAKIGLEVHEAVDRLAVLGEGLYGVLVRYTKDPLGDLDAGRYDALVAAELEQVGLRATR